MVEGLSHECDRMRGWISAELDGELSDFESVLLQSHVRECDSCGRFRMDTAAFSAALRAAPHEALSRQVAVSHRRRRVLQPVRVPAVAAVAVSAIALSVVFASLHSGSIIGRENQAVAGSAFDDQDVRQLQLQRRQAEFAQLLARRAKAREAAVDIPRDSGFVNP
jgi:predicted anti-sigma-YlaC factor YlaD